jgi:signal transduction histidine kinase
MKSIKTKFLLPILAMQFVALAVLGFIGYRFSGNIIMASAEQRFKSTIDGVYDQIEADTKLRVEKVAALMSDPIFIKYNAAPYYKSDVDAEVFNFQKGNGLILGEPEVGGLVNYPIGLLPNEGNRGITSEGLFPTEEYVGMDGYVKQHVYLGGSNDMDFESPERTRLNRSDKAWFQKALKLGKYVGRPEAMPLYLKKYDPVSITTEDMKKDEELVPIALLHKIGDANAGILMVSTSPNFIKDALPTGDIKSLLLITDSDGETIASAGDKGIENEIKGSGVTLINGADEGKIVNSGTCLMMHRALPATGWHIEVFGRKSDIYRGIVPLRRNIILVMAISMTITGLMIFFIIRQLLKPVFKLTSASKRIADGELGLTIDHKDDDEIGKLADSFNRMSTSTKDMHDRISRINYVRKQMLHIISHELRTPLSGIVNFFELIREELGGTPGGEKTEMGELLGGLGNNIDKYKRLVTRLTKTTSVMSGEMQALDEVDVEDCDPAEAIEASMADARGYRKEITLERSGTCERVACPPDALKLIMDEALSNAIKYSPEGTPIVISLSSDDKMVTISIKDLGSGIPKEYIEDVLEPFFEVEDSMHHFTDRYKSGGGGLGLGLTIISSVIKRYQGSFAIDSEVGKWTTLTLKLPISKKV